MCSKNYPVEILEGYFSLGEEKIYIPSRGSANNGWGNSGPTHIIGDLLKPIPDKMFIRWFSFVEDKFYEGEFPINQDALASLFAKETETYLGSGKRKFKELNVGLAPGGLVVIWISNGVTQKEISSFKANEVKLSIKDLIPNGIQDRQAYVDIVLKDDLEQDVLDNIRANGIEYLKWNKYREKYNWKPTIKFENKGSLNHLGFSTYNAERETMLVETYKKSNNFKNRAVIKEIRLNWHDQNKNNFGTLIEFNEKEIWDAFKKIYKNKDIKQAELVFTIDKYSETAIFLKSETDSIELKKAKIKTYSISPD